MRRFMIAVMLIALVPAPALAQQKGPPTARTDYEKKQDAAINRAYEDTLKRENASLPKPKKDDPWGSLRATPTSSSATR